MTTHQDAELPAEIMGLNSQRIPHSALYTSATWKWGQLAYADCVTPRQAEGVFRLVNAYLALYRRLNPQKISLKHNLLHRHAAIDHLIQASSCRQIIEIAAGFSPRGCFFSEQPERQYFEVDLAEVIALKRQQLQSSVRGRQVLERSNFTLQTGDITRLDFMAFAKVPTLLVSEGIMMYFQRDAQQLIWRNIAQFVRTHGSEYIFDYIPLDDEPPRSTLGQVLSNMRQKLFKPPPAFAYDERTRHDVRDDLLAAGFSAVEIINTADVAQSWQLPHPEVATRTIIYHCR